MQSLFVALNDIPPQGREIIVNDPDVWQKPIEEFDMDCRVTTPLTATLFLLPTTGGCLVRGHLDGDVVIPCDRCAEDTAVHIEHTVEIFAALDTQISQDTEGTVDDMLENENAHVVWEKGIPLLDVPSLCWEEFMLSLPLRPLCSADCKGLCVHCGANLNVTTCQCSQDEGDPRLAILRQYKVQAPDNSSDA